VEGKEKGRGGGGNCETKIADWERGGPQKVPSIVGTLGSERQSASNKKGKIGDERKENPSSTLLDGRKGREPGPFMEGGAERLAIATTNHYRNSLHWVYKKKLKELIGAKKTRDQENQVSELHTCEKPLREITLKRRKGGWSVVIKGAEGSPKLNSPKVSRYSDTKFNEV